MLAVARESFSALEEALGHDGGDGGGDPVTRLRQLAHNYVSFASYVSFAREQPHRYRVMFGHTWNAEKAVRRSQEGGNGEVLTTADDLRGFWARRLHSVPRRRKRLRRAGKLHQPRRLPDAAAVG